MVMVDILLKQIELAEIRPNLGTGDETVQKVMKCLTQVVRAPWQGTHICENPDVDDFVDCNYCQTITIFYELLLDVVQYLCPKRAVKIEMPTDDDVEYPWDETVAETGTQEGLNTYEELQPSELMVTTPHGTRKSIETVIEMEGRKYNREMATYSRYWMKNM